MNTVLRGAAAWALTTAAVVLTVPTQNDGERVLTEARRQGQINLHRDYEDGSMYDQSREHSVNRLVISYTTGHRVLKLSGYEKLSQGIQIFHFYDYLSYTL